MCAPPEDWQGYSEGSWHPRCLEAQRPRLLVEMTQRPDPEREGTSLGPGESAAGPGLEPCLCCNPTHLEVAGTQGRESGAFG